ncbi:MAG: hypothetical protein ACLR23_27555 [Clostridia bacterium]
MVERLQEREDCLARLCQDYLLTFLKIQRLTESLANAIRGTLVKKKVGKYSYYDLQVWEKGASVSARMSGRNSWRRSAARWSCDSIRNDSFAD